MPPRAVPPPSARPAAGETAWSAVFFEPAEAFFVRVEDDGVFFVSVRLAVAVMPACALDLREPLLEALEPLLETADVVERCESDPVQGAARGGVELALRVHGS